jgi:pentatricopeptide repeat-containing protein PET309
MLERTAGCLESGTLRRLLPASKKSTKSRRTLHSGFWTHGAADLELSPLWTALVRASDLVEHQEGAKAQRKNNAVQNTLLLDFLYPAGTLNFLRNYSGWWADRPDGRYPRGLLGRLGHRQYTSFATEPKDSFSCGTAVKLDSTIEAANYEVAEDIIASLYEMLGLNKPYDYEEAWRQYNNLRSVDQDRLRNGLMYYLRGSDRIVDAERTTELFDMLEESERNAGSYRWTIRAYLRLRNLSEAMRLHARGLETLEIPAGSEELLAYLVKSSSWSHAISIWKTRRHYPISTYNIYEVLDSMPNISTFAKELADFADQKIRVASTDRATNEIKDFTTEIVRRALLKPAGFDPDQFFPLLHVLQKWQKDTPWFYDEAFKMLVDLDQTKLVIQCYQKARQLKHVAFKQWTLNNVLKIYCSHHSVTGMKQVLDDSFRMHDGPTQYAYRLCMREFASQGDAQTVHALFDQYVGRFSKDFGKAITTANDVVPVLQVHAKRAEFREVISWFKRIESDYGLEPTIMCWNILMNAHGKIHDFDGAITTFSKILENTSLKPDDYTFGTMLGICSVRGDTDLAHDIYDLAEQFQITKTTAMLDAIVHCHCQDNELDKAEEICEKALGMKLRGHKTRMWNYLLVAYAMRYDIVNVNRVLQRMAEVKIEYDQYTYSALMQALCMVNQPHRAYSILKDVMPEAGVAATPFHYAVVMGGFIASGEFHKVFQVHNRYLRRGMAKSADTSLMLLKSLVKEEQTSQGENGGEVDLPQAMHMFQNVMSSRDAQEISSTPKKGSHNMPLDIAYPAMFHGYMLFILGQNNQFNTVDELYDAYKGMLPKSRQGKPPANILSAIMASKLRQNDHKTVQQCWELALSEAKRAGSPLPTPRVLTSKNLPVLKAVQEESVTTSRVKILPSHRFALSKHLNYYMRSLFDQEKRHELTSTVDNLLSEGFELDGSNWNLYVSLLARKFSLKTAFQVCENKLMPGWTGWARIRRALPERNRLPIEIRRARRQPGYLRPQYHTFLWLGRGYLKIEAQAAESRAAESMMEWLSRECPKTVNALRTMQRSDGNLENAILNY